MENKAKIVYQDEEIFVVDKKAGVVCTKEDRRSVGTLEDWLLEKFGNNNLPRQGIVHRLDKGTSGLLVIARTAEARKRLMEMFKARKIVEKYVALVEGDLPMEGEVAMPIGRSRYVFGRFAVREDGKVARTCFTLLKKYYLEGKAYSLAEIDLKTGRTHQIRVHFSYLKWPLSGDLVYGGKELMGLKRPFLHSKSLSFKHPVSKKMLSFESELASDLKEVLGKL